MNKKPSLSIQSKQSNLINNNDNTTTHSLSKRKQFLTIITRSHR